MAKGQQVAALRLVHTLFNVGVVGGLTDGQLLGRFKTRGGEAAELAFAALVARHGLMVLRVCRSILRDEDEAQDAFQATFLVLVEKAGSLWVRDSLGPWLHGVAYRVASCARSASARRRRHERRAAERAGRPVRDEVRDDLMAVLHAEVDRLPERFRAAIVLCDLEGLTHKQAAQRLGWPVGTVESRLARGRERLRGRLARRGLAPSAGLLGTALASASAAGAGAVSAGLRDSTARAALRFAAGQAASAGAVSTSVAALVEGVLRTMLMAKMKMAVASAFALGLVATGAGVLAQQETRRQPTREAGPPRIKYEIRIWKDGEPAGEPIVVNGVDGKEVQVETPHGSILIRPAALGEARAQAKASRSPGGDGHMMGMMPGQMGYGGMMDMMPGMMHGQMGMGYPNGMAGPAREGTDLRSKDFARLKEEGQKSRKSGEGYGGGYGGYGMGGTPDQEQRLREVERKLDQVLKELEGSKATKDRQP